jgi:hypothetical protein
MRILLHIFLPLITPLILYSIWAKIDAKRKGKGLPDWEEGQWFWILVVGFVLTAGSLIYLTTLGEDTERLYQSPRLENGRIVPGHFKDK